MFDILFHLPLAIVGWDDLIIAAASALFSAGAQKAMTPDSNSSSTGFGNIPTMDNVEGNEMQAWLAELAKQRGARKQAQMPQDTQKGGMM